MLHKNQNNNQSILSIHFTHSPINRLPLPLPYGKNSLIPGSTHHLLFVKKRKENNAYLPTHQSIPEPPKPIHTHIHMGQSSSTLLIRSKWKPYTCLHPPQASLETAPQPSPTLPHTLRLSIHPFVHLFPFLL